MKKLHEFDFNCIYPMYIEGEKLLNASEYAAFLIRKGYAITENAVVADDVSNSDALIASVTVVEESSPLGNQNRTVDEMFDDIEAKAKADFVKRGRKAKKENA